MSGICSTTKIDDLERPTSRSYSISKKSPNAKKRGETAVCGNINSEAADRMTAVRDPAQDAVNGLKLGRRS